MPSSPVQSVTRPAEAHAGEVRKLSTLLEASQALSLTLGLMRICSAHHAGSDGRASAATDGAAANTSFTSKIGVAAR